MTGGGLAAHARHADSVQTGMSLSFLTSCETSCGPDGPDNGENMSNEAPADDCFKKDLQSFLEGFEQFIIYLS